MALLETPNVFFYQSLIEMVTSHRGPEAPPKRFFPQTMQSLGDTAEIKRLYREIRAKVGNTDFGSKSGCNKKCARGRFRGHLSSTKFVVSLPARRSSLVQKTKKKPPPNHEHLKKN